MSRATTRSTDSLPDDGDATINLSELVALPVAEDDSLNSLDSEHPNNPCFGHRYVYHLAVCNACSAQSPDGYDRAMLMAKTDASRQRIFAVEMMRRSMKRAADTEARQEIEKVKKIHLDFTLDAVKTIGQSVAEDRQVEHLLEKKKVLQKVFTDFRGLLSEYHCLLEDPLHSNISRRTVTRRLELHLDHLRDDLDAVNRDIEQKTAGQQ